MGGGRETAVAHGFRSRRPGSHREPGDVHRARLFAGAIRRARGADHDGAGGHRRDARVPGAGSAGDGGRLARAGQSYRMDQPPRRRQVEGARRGGGPGEPLEQQAKCGRQRRERAVRAAGRRRGSRARSRFRRSRRGRRARARRVGWRRHDALEARRRANRGVSGRQGRRAGSRRGASASSCRVGHPRRGR